MPTKTTTGKPKILIIYGYHPKEIFAIEVGGYLRRDNLNADIRLVKYDGKPDKGMSLRNLRKFVENFNPLISPIVLHGDDDIGINAAIIYHAQSKQKERKALRPLSEFCLKNSCEGNNIIAWGRFLTKNAKYSIIDIELNSIMGLKKAAALVSDFSQYLLDFYSEKNLAL